ncbi:MAG: BppU family phage baseplate upper protein, partial [Alphaproteobacteria bacterium]|nr:BppU family phage baseplate upper protein [Alphaproteobacteria bacterium]
MTGMMTRNGILIRQGDSYDIAMHFKSKNGDDFDISGAQISFNVKNESALLFAIAGELVEPKRGKALIKILPQHTNIDAGKYEANIKIVFANGDVHTIFPQDITQNAVFEISE